MHIVSINNGVLLPAYIMNKQIMATSLSKTKMLTAISKVNTRWLRESITAGTRNKSILW